MGLRTASVRRQHPPVMVMAPALTEQPNEANNCKLTSSSPSLNGHETNKSLYNNKSAPASDNAYGTEPQVQADALKTTGAGPGSIMSDSPSPQHMGDIYHQDQDDNMGLQKSGMDDIASFMKEKKNEVDHLFNNIGAVEPDISQNVEELMQVIKSMESGSDRLGSEAEAMFPDLASNLSSFEKELLNDVDVMNMSIEESLIDSGPSLKESRSKELISELQMQQIKLERRSAFLLRRLRKVQAKYMGQHVSEEIAGVFEHVHRTLRHTNKSTDLSTPLPAENLKPITQSSARNLVRKLESAVALQASTFAKQRHASKYLGVSESGVGETSSGRNSSKSMHLPSWTAEPKYDLERVSGMLQSDARLIEDEIDSDATLSSSGGESCDEMQPHNNSQQQHLPIQKRAAWRYANDRAAVAVRWMWLQSQMTDLDYRIRQYSDLHKRIRLNKGRVALGGASPPRNIPTSPSAVNGYRGQLPGASPLSVKTDPASGASTSDPQCSRTRPLTNFRKRKLLQTWGLHLVSKKAARSSTVRCGCTPPGTQCALCTGRTDPTRPRDLPEHLSKSERVALLDPCYHSAFSFPEDVSANVHLEAIMKTTDWQQRSSRAGMKAIKYIPKVERNDAAVDVQPKKPEQKRKYNRLIKPSTLSALSAKIKNKMRGKKPGLKKKRHPEKTGTTSTQAPLPLGMDGLQDEVDHGGSSGGSVKLDSPSSSPLLTMQTISSYNRRSSNRVSSYDIDNIVIPYSMAASTRVEKLEYKDIPTPKWRLVDGDFPIKYFSKNNGQVGDTSQDSDQEDVTEDAVNVRHDKCEQDERKRFMDYLKFPLGYGRSRSHKRTDSRAESSGCNTPDPMSPHPVEGSEATNSPVTSPPATPLSVNVDESAGTLPSISALRRRTVSQSRGKEGGKEDLYSSMLDQYEVIPYDAREFPLSEEEYERMVESMPEDHQLQTNRWAQDGIASPVSEDFNRPDSPGSESTESVIGDEDPNDPEWIDFEATKERYKR